MPSYNINVNVNPQAQPPATAINNQLQPMTSAQTPFNRQMTVGGTVKAIAGLSALQSVGSTFLGQVGVITGQDRLDRRIERTSGFITDLGLIGAGGIYGIAAITAREFNEATTNYFRRKNENQNAMYLGTLRGNKVLGNR